MGQLPTHIRAGIKVKVRAILTCLLFTLLLPAPASHAAIAKTISFQAEVWADNWFELYINGKKVGQDSVPITTEKSFNSEKIKFTATYPFTVAVLAKDYTENFSGLEYIGKSNQQIGDGGIVLQIRDLTKNTIVAATDRSWKSLVINRAPLNPECVTSSAPLTDCKWQQSVAPTSWTSKTFNDKKWIFATEFTKEAVGVKEGYFNISWSSSAQLIWSSDLKLDNQVLLRKIITTPTTSTASKNLIVASSDIDASGKFSKEITCDGAGRSPQISWSGTPSNTKSFVITMHSEPGPPRPGETITGSHGYLILFNIPPTVTSISGGSKEIGTFGQNFQGKSLGYTPPCSQGPGAKKYTITLYALTSPISLTAQEATLATVQDAVKGKVISTSIIDGSYSRS
jgi:phosphatidylethanolamine-binding protein (PEBP) family uncharacterized protein